MAQPGQMPQNGNMDPAAMNFMRARMMGTM
jgi:hypothetical protein